MKKILVSLLAVFLIIGSARALQLWEYGSFEERAEVATEAGIVANISDYTGSLEQNLHLLEYYQGHDVYEGMLGGTLPVAGSTYNLAGSGISSSATSFTLQSFTITQTGQKIYDADLSDTFYFTIEPGNKTRQEIVACTTLTQNAGGTATASGCSRGMSMISPYTASSTLAFAHSGGSQVILSDPPQLFNEFTAKSNNDTITGTWNFAVTPTSSDTCTATTEFCTKNYIDNMANQGAATSTESIGGILELATQQEMASSTDLGTQIPLGLQAKYATSTPSAYSSGEDHYVVVTEDDFKLNQGFYDLSEVWTWTGGIVVNSATSTVLNVKMENATVTDELIVGPTVWDAPSSTLTVDGSAYFTGNATTSGSLNVGGDLDVGSLLTFGSIASTTDFGFLASSSTPGDFTDDTTITLGYRPSFIRIDYAISGVGTDGSTYENRCGYFIVNDGLLGVQSQGWGTGTGGGVGCATLALAAFGNVTSIDAGETDSGNDDISITLSVSAVSSTGFTIRRVTALGGGTNTNNSYSSVAWTTYR